MIRSRKDVRRIGLLVGLLLLGAGCAAQKPAAADRPAGVDFYVQAVQAQRAGNADQATDLLEKAVAANPDLRLAHVQLGDIYRAKGDYSRAATHYEVATRLDRYTLSNHYNLGVAYQLLNRLQDAAKAYLEALQLNPRDLKSNMNLGLVYLALGQTDDGIAYLKRATQIDPSYAPAWSNLGVALDAQQNYSQAESTYRKALELDSTNLATQQNLAQNLISQNKAPEAIAILEQVLRRDESPPIRRRYAEALSLNKKYDDALAQLDLALKADPNYTPAMNEKANTLIRRYVDGLELDESLHQKAIELWQSSLKINPNQPRVIEQLRKWQNPGMFGN